MKVAIRKQRVPAKARSRTARTGLIVFKGRNKRWFWRWVHENYEIGADCAEGDGYGSQRDCRRGWDDFFRDALIRAPRLEKPP